MAAVGAELASGGPGGPLAAESLANVLAVHLIRHVLVPRSPARGRDGTLPRGRLRAVVENLFSNGITVGAHVDTHVDAHVDIEHLFDAADIPDDEEFDIDFHELLAGNRLIAHIWGTEDVQDVRPDLDDDQAWQVLQTLERQLNSEYGISWQTIEDTAEELYGPRPERRWHGRIDVSITDTDGYGQGEVINCLRDMAAALAKGMPAIKASADEGSVRLGEEPRP
jgi:hypothetical protein